MMSRTELEAVVHDAIMQSSGMKIADRSLLAGFIVARAVGVSPQRRAAVAGGVQSILADCHALGWHDADRVTGLVADWVLEQVTE